MISSGRILGAPILLLGCRLFACQNTFIGVLNTILPNLVDIAGKGFGFFLSVAILGNQLVYLVQLLLIVPRHDDGFLVGVQSDTHLKFLQ